MAKGYALEELIHEGFYCDVIKLATITTGVHVFLEVLVHVFKDEHELVLGVDHIV